MDERNWVPFEEVMAETLKDPIKRQAIMDARKRLASVLYPDGGPEYQRMLRGEGPPEDHE